MAVFLLEYTCCEPVNGGLNKLQGGEIQY